MKTQDQKVLITGGSAGIGLALARALAGRGNRVLIAARRRERLERVQELVPGILTTQCDVTDEADLRALVQTVERQLGGVSILINNAGIQRNDDYAAGSTDTILQHVDEEIGLNFTGLVKLTALCLPLLRREPEAAVVNISSLLALAPKQSAPVYCATKAAVRSFTKALRYQLEDGAPTVRVVDVLPPMVDTGMTSGRSGKKLTPDEVADGILRGLERDEREIPLGATRSLARLQRLSPAAADRAVRRR